MKIATSQWILLATELYFDIYRTMEMKSAINAFSALAQESRLKILRLLIAQGPGPLSAGELAERLSIQPATLSFHLKELVNAGLIQSQRRGRSILYGADLVGVRDLVRFLLEDCCQGRPELCDIGTC